MLQGLSPAHILTAHFQRPRLCLHRILQLAWCRREGTRPLCVAVVCVRSLLCAPGTRDEQGGSYPGQISRKPGRSPACLHSSRCPRQTTRVMAQHRLGVSICDTAGLAAANRSCSDPHRYLGVLTRRLRGRAYLEQRISSPPPPKCTRTSGWRGTDVRP